MINDDYLGLKARIAELERRVGKLEATQSPVSDDQTSTNTTLTLLTEIEAATYLTLSRTTLRQQRMKKPDKRSLIPYVPYIRIGTQIRYKLSELNLWIESHKRVNPKAYTHDSTN